MTWELLTTRAGGSVGALAVATAADGAALVFAATPAGLRVSADAGRTWRPTGPGGPAFAESVAASPRFAQDRTLYVGTRLGLYRSTDAGLTWRLVLGGGRILSVVAAPDERGEPVLFAGSEADGILRSADGGRTWAGANPGLLDLTVLALALSPAFTRDRTALAATASGLYRTRNGGRAWRGVDLPLDEPAVQCLALSPRFHADGLAFAGTEGHGLLRSADGGATWEEVAALAGRSVIALAASRSGRLVAAATAEGVAVSADGGEHWGAPDDLGPALSLAWAPDTDGEALLAGRARLGPARSTDAGRTWAAAGDGLAAALVTGLVAARDPDGGEMLALATLEEGIAVSRDGGRSWAADDHFGAVGAGGVFAVAAAMGSAPDRALFAQSDLGLHRSRDGGAAWALLRAWAPPPTFGGLAVAPGVVVAAGRGGAVLLSEDDGETWRTAVVPGGEIAAVTASPGYRRDRTLFVVTAAADAEGEGPVALWRSVDGGQQWARWFEGHGPAAASLCVPPTYPADGALFLGLGGRVLAPRWRMEEVRGDERRPLWRAAELAGPLTALVAAPRYGRYGTLVAGTAAGVSLSRDRGERFVPWGAGPLAVAALACSEDAAGPLVYAAGLGGALWRGWISDMADADDTTRSEPQSGPSARKP